ncbi:MAG: hypothetical protein ACW99G_18930 [Candidatus Thorarchaeota archaeon]|jgi:hypothetical protein
MPKTLAASVTGITNPTNIVVSTAHSSSTATATITAPNKTVNIGDNITIDLGYTGDTGRVFKGYIKNIVRSVPEDEYTIIAKDDLVRATDFFIVPTNPDSSYKWHNIKAETLIQNVLELAGLTSFDFSNTSFTFATKAGNDVEVKLASSYDFCKTIADLLAWQFWADETGTILLRNRKPYPMDGPPESSQPGYIADTPISGVTLTDTTSMNSILTTSDRNLRNRVVVHGTTGIYAEAKSATSYNPITDAQENILPTTPTQFYKAMALISPIIDNQGMANDSVSYNLALYNRLDVSAQMQVEGNHKLLARKVVAVNEAKLGLTGNWYIYQAEHQWSREGYFTNLELRI